MAHDRKAPPIIFTDDGWIFTAEKNVTVADLKEKVVDGYAGTGGALWWSTGDHEVYQFETEIGERFGDESSGLDATAPSFVHSATPGVEEQLAANLQGLIAECGGPLTALARLCREAQIPFFPRVRMNSHYVIDPIPPRLRSLPPRAASPAHWPPRRRIPRKVGRVGHPHRP